MGRRQVAAKTIRPANRRGYLTAPRVARIAPGMRYRLLSVVALVSLSGCVHQHERGQLAAESPEFDVAQFFNGQTEGTGTFHRGLRRVKQMVVRGTGRAVDDRLVLTQRVLIEDEPPRSRTWDLHRVAPGQWRGTITDSPKPVTLVVTGNAAHIRYPSGTGMRVDQWIYLQPDGRTAVNRMSVMKFGAKFARIEETIRRLD